MASSAPQRQRQRRYAPRSRSGCLTCRTRRKRCDGTHPTCQNCVRLNVQCIWEERRQIISPDNLSPLPACSSTAGSSMYELAQGRDMLNYYMTTFVPSISVAALASNFYTTLYIPMAFQSDGVLSALIACSSAHRAKSTIDTNESQRLRELSAQHQLRCHHFLKERIALSGQPYKDAYEVVAITLLLVGLEVQNGTVTSKWIRQLDCARGVLRALATSSKGKQSWEYECLEHHFTYHSTLASLMMSAMNYQSSPPAEDVSDSLSEDSMSPVPTSVEEAVCTVVAPPSPHLSTSPVDPLMGIAGSLFPLIEQINRLPRHCLTPSPAFLALESEILSWRASTDLLASTVPLPTSLDLTALAEAYRVTALIYLYRRCSLYNSSSILSGLASRAMAFIARIPPGSPAEAGLTSPLFLAGAELVDEEQKSQCRERLRKTRERYRFLNISNAESVLEEVWRERREGGWEEVVRDWGWCFSLA